MEHNQQQYRVTIEMLDSSGWHTVCKTTDYSKFKEFINLCGFAKLLNKTRSQLRHLFNS